MLAVTRGVPYVTDGNESFSMLIHASNLYHFPVSQTFGLSDEALSREPAAHPYVYTHQGNFPRLFSFLLYVLGARGVESQIVITTFTVGLLSVFLIYHYFSTISSTGFAVAAASVFLTDYLLFAQWQVNTYRVWHGVFFFLALLCVHGLEGSRRRFWVLTTFISYVCLFYFELVFGAYVAIMAGLYAGVRLWTRPKLLVSCWSLQAAGALTAVLILVGQLIGYLGWTDFLQDLQMTYTARNLLTADPTYIDRIRDFVDSRHIVFWYNLAAVEYQRSGLEMLSSIVTGYFTTYTPILWYFVAILTIGWFTGMCQREPKAASPAAAPARTRGVALALVPGLLLMTVWARFLLALVQPQALSGVDGARRLGVDQSLWPVVIALALSAGSMAAASRATTGSWVGLHRLPAARVVWAAVTLLVAEHVVLNSDVLFDPVFLPLWSHIQGAWFAGWAVQMLVVAAGGFAALAVLHPEVIGETRWPALASFMVCGLAGYLAIYALSPGYVQTGYLQRSVPFGSFVLETAIALCFYLAWSAAHRLGRRLYASWGRRTRRSPAARRAAQTLSLSIGTGAAVCALLFTVLYWANVQAVHTRLVPPTHFTFIQQLAKAPYRGASFTANTYAAPIYAYTGEWAYFDTRLGLHDGGAVTVTGDGYSVNRDARTYLWLADRQRNDEYQRPAYFLCFRFQDLRSAVERLGGRQVGCSSAGAVRDAMDGAPLSVGREVVARDTSGRDDWAIVKLDWSVLGQRARPTGIGTQE